MAMEFVHRFFKQIMWRSSKIHVSEELQLPSQEECLSWLTFSAIEEHFYQKQHETCVTYAHQIISSCKNDIHQRKSSDTSCSDSLSRTEVEKLLFPLLKLRQACCHPQVGSYGLCSLQRSPLTMEEILDVLIGKAMVEGEEALRIIVVALNGLAGIAIIEQGYNRAVSLYKEALTLADENSNDFRLDPLLSIHILHNLAELLPVTSEFLPHCPFIGTHPSENNDHKKTSDSVRFERYYVKRRKVSEDKKSVSTTNGRSFEQYKKLDGVTFQRSTVDNDEDGAIECDGHNQVFSRCYNDGCLKRTCENIKQKYLSLFVSKLSLAQQEFRNSYTQVCSTSEECKNQILTWWLHALDIIEENKDSSEELLKKIDQTVSSVAASSRPVKISSRIRSIAGLKYTIQTGLDSLETSRQAVINRILEIDQTMVKPNIVDIERKRYCPNCNNGNGSLCINCELDQLFQIYEAGLFLIKKAKSGAVIASEDAIEIQKQKTALNRFFRESEISTKSNSGDEKSKQRHVREEIQVSKSPSPLEITLGVIKTFSKKILGRQDVASARKHLLLFEAMRKEYAQARCLSVAQSQLLGAYDEIRMSTTRMRLKETEDEPNSATVLSREELISHSLQYSSDKFLSLNKLAGIKGQLRYLKGLAVSNQKVQNIQLHSSSKLQDAADLSNSSLAITDSDCISDTEEESCPVCHEKLCNPKMVFPCGHVLCCRCCLQMTEKANIQFGKCQQKWIMCPTCRQRADTEHIAYVDEKRDKCGSLTSNYFQAEDLPEDSIAINGSYGTKIEAVTRRILWITSRDKEAKVLVFSSWNDVLDVLSHALDANSITYVRMKGGRKSHDAIAKFKGLKNSVQGDSKIEDRASKSKPIRVLLMLIQHGANGLNILEAQHVILVEPLLNPAAEAQAISRVHRVGQEKQTFVHRFIVKNSVEESIYELNRSRNVSSIISAKAKNKHQPLLTIQDVESLFPMKVPAEQSEDAEVSAGSFRHLPPAVAAGLAAERRLMERQINST